jgi:hypothetical protein
MQKASTAILPVEIGMAHSSVFLSFMNMQFREEFINEHTAPDPNHRLDFYIRQNASFCLVAAGIEWVDGLIFPGSPGVRRGLL